MMIGLGNICCITVFLLLLLLLMICVVCNGAGYLSTYPPGCDTNAALQCEYKFLLCKLFTGPANDPTTVCNCATEYYGSCLRLAGCETAREVGPLTNHEIYMRTCVDLIISNNCPDPLICAINCASDTEIDLATTKIIPFNNYGQYYLRVKTCLQKVQQQRLARYSTIQQVSCNKLSDFEVCSRWIPPSTFVPVALPINTTYIEIDSCIITNNGSYSCLTDPAPKQVYGSRYLFPTSFEVASTNLSVCHSDSKSILSSCSLSILRTKRGSPILIS